ncbi:MAG: hypothetical protein WBB07_00835 [Mycobacterium sp.]
MSETSDEFSRARNRFEQSWNRENGDNPINDSAEVQRATEALKLSREQLTRVGVDLQNIAASLAEAQRSCAQTISWLESRLQDMDDAISRTISETGLTIDELDISAMEGLAAADVREAWRAVHNARDTYSGHLTRSMIDMQAEGYNPSAIDKSDGVGRTDATAADLEAAEYGFMQRAADQELVDNPGTITPQKQAAADRLRDFATINDPNASAEAIEYAGQRLRDHQQAVLPIPGPRDSILGLDTRSRAQSRLRMQKALEEGTPWLPPMSPDEATASMNKDEARLQAEVLDKTQAVLVEAGMARKSAEAISDAMASGWTLQDLQAYADITGTAAGDLEGRMSVGRHAVDRFDPDTLRSISELGKYVKGGGTLLEALLTVEALMNGAPPGETIGGLLGGLGGSTGGAIGLGLLGGALLGPGGAFVGVVTGTLGGGSIGEGIGGYAGGKLFDK